MKLTTGLLLAAGGYYLFYYKKDAAKKAAPAAKAPDVRDPPAALAPPEGEEVYGEGSKGSMYYADALPGDVTIDLDYVPYADPIFGGDPSAQLEGLGHCCANCAHGLPCSG